ncbi:replication protein A 32 kDa subunit isoform X2 [Agrilus planipennis]|uniref:Replication protein A 32 kDa subunit isoform X2 n=1 Tax=Agrilus planipennis TaxID=224129 RepID=A0A7F5QZP9_AGRPL|nr:replication protein A 32 kDa subunit isoform X2 [Agrilus planipennis]
MMRDTSNTTADNFFDTPNHFDSPAQGKNGKSLGARRLQNTVPVCIRQILDQPGEEFKLFGMSAQILCVVGILKEFEVQATKATYEIEDHTGNISAIWWLENDANSTPNLPAVKEGCYVKVFGSLKNRDGMKSLMVLRMFPLDTINEITTHLLEVIGARLEAEVGGKANTLARINANNPGAELANSMAFINDVDMLPKAVGLTALQTKIFNIIIPVTAAQGISRDAVLMKFPPNQHRDVNDALDFLVNEGHAYSTVDNDHFKITDPM